MTQQKEHSYYSPALSLFTELSTFLLLPLQQFHVSLKVFIRFFPFIIYIKKTYPFSVTDTPLNVPFHAHWCL